jgi:isopenicillin N synthase-like dioxygenase
MLWSEYLCRGISPPACSQEQDQPNHIAHSLMNCGWVSLSVDLNFFTPNELNVLQHWESLFASAFDLSRGEKEAAGTYRTQNGVSVGYRIDDEREFFETRMTSEGLPEPMYHSIDTYDENVKLLFCALNKIARLVLTSVACQLAIDPQFFFDLTDIDCNGILPECSTKDKQSGETILSANLSSSLLRICKYTNDAVNVDSAAPTSASTSISTSKSKSAPTTPKTPAVWFGAHTDSSFITLSLPSSTPGLQIVDQQTNSWVCPEALFPSAPGTVSPAAVPHHVSVAGDGAVSVPAFPFGTARSNSNSDAVNRTTAQEREELWRRRDGGQCVRVVAFVGEFLQVLTKSLYRAAVHRVAEQQGQHQYQHQEAVAEGGDGLSVARPVTRISCPYIIRGRHGAVISLRDAARYTHPGGDEAVSEEKMPNLDGTSVRMMHKLLDLKRQKCFRENGSAEGKNWVLSAYPVPELPPEL